MDARFRFPVCLAVILSCSVFSLHGQDEKQKNPPLKADGATVFLKVGITDAMNRNVTGLKKEHFKVFEDKVEQEIIHFEQNVAPMIFGIVLDTSPSMKENEYTEGAKKAILRFLKSAETPDESFLVIFNETIRLMKDLKQQGFPLDDDAVFQYGGNTALYDAVYLGLDHIRNSRYDSNALVLITDGEDTNSRYSPREVLEFAKELNVQIYWIGQPIDTGHGNAIILEMVKTTGGRAFFPNNYRELDYYLDLIYFGLRNQYVLGYKPINQARDGRWRHVKVELHAPEQLPKLKVRVREGYYAHKY